MKLHRAIIVAALMLFPIQASAESVHLFDDLNGDGISDTEQKTIVPSDSDAPSEESIDAVQPDDSLLNPEDGGTEEQPTS